MSARQLEVIRLTAEGLTRKEIALSWGRSVKTVDWHWLQASGKLGIQSAVDATKYAIKHGLIPLP